MDGGEEMRSGEYLLLFESVEVYGTPVAPGGSAPDMDEPLGEVDARIGEIDDRLGGSE